MKKKEKTLENYLEKIPKHKTGLDWTIDENGLVTLNILNTGVFNRIAQKLFRKPKVSYIHLDKLGSFVWPLIDGEKDIFELGEAVDEKFKAEAHPLYPRLAKFFQIVDSYGFIEWVKE